MHGSNCTKPILVCLLLFASALALAPTAEADDPSGEPVVDRTLCDGFDRLMVVVHQVDDGEASGTVRPCGPILEVPEGSSLSYRLSLGGEDLLVAQPDADHDAPFTLRFASAGDPMGGSMAPLVSMHARAEYTTEHESMEDALAAQEPEPGYGGSGPFAVSGIGQNCPPHPPGSPNTFDFDLATGKVGTTGGGSPTVVPTVATAAPLPVTCVRGPLIVDRYDWFDTRSVYRVDPNSACEVHRHSTELLDSTNRSTPAYDNAVHSNQVWSMYHDANASQPPANRDCPPQVAQMGSPLPPGTTAFTNTVLSATIVPQESWMKQLAHSEFHLRPTSASPATFTTHVWEVRAVHTGGHHAEYDKDGPRCPVLPAQQGQPMHCGFTDSVDALPRHYDMGTFTVDARYSNAPSAGTTASATAPGGSGSGASNNGSANNETRGLNGSGSALQVWGFNHIQPTITLRTHLNVTTGWCANPWTVESWITIDISELTDPTPGDRTTWWINHTVTGDALLHDSTEIPSGPLVQGRESVYLLHDITITSRASCMISQGNALWSGNSTDTGPDQEFHII